VVKVVFDLHVAALLAPARCDFNDSTKKKRNAKRHLTSGRGWIQTFGDKQASMLWRGRGDKDPAPERPDLHRIG